MPFDGTLYTATSSIARDERAQAERFVGPAEVFISLLAGLSRTTLEELIQMGPD